MNLKNYIAKQFGNPSGLGGKLSTFVMNRINQKQYKAVINSLNISEEDNILDIGFGNGYLLQKLSKKKICNYFGIDISDDMITAAKNRNSHLVESGKLHLQIGNIMKTNYPNFFFDKIYTVNTIYFWEDIGIALSEIKRILKPDGVFINAFYSKQYLDKIKYAEYGFIKYSVDELKNIMMLNGFEIVDTKELKEESAYCMILKNKKM